MHGNTHDWRADRRVLRAHDIATFVAAAVSAARFGVQRVSRGQSPPLLLALDGRHRMHRYDVTARSSAPPAVVYSLIADVPSYVQWQSVTRVELARSRSESPGEGAVWVLHQERSATQLRVVAAEPPRMWAYRMRDRSVWREYLAQIDLRGDPRGGTRIRWHGSFEPLDPGFHRFWDSYMGWTMQQRVERLAAFAADAVRGPLAGG